MVKVGMLPAKLKSSRGLSSALLFTSALVFTTTVIVMFLDVRMIAKISTILPLTSPRGNYFDLPGPEQFTLGGLNVRFSRPYAWLFSPLFAIGAILAIVSFVTLYIDEVR